MNKRIEILGTISMIGWILTILYIALTFAWV